jgi:SAM-dependent methyltransferase
MENTFQITQKALLANEPEFESWLLSAETFSLNSIPDLSRGSVLDIGVGTGRLIPLLSTMFQSYVGIDIAENAVRKAKVRHPGANVLQMDARSLQFADQSFDCVLFAFNGLDYVDFADRNRMLQEIRRILRPGGFFIYSTHSLRYKRAAVWKNRLVVKELFDRRPVNVIRSLRNRVRFFRGQSHDEEHGVSFINDTALEFSIFTTYVDVAKEIERLRDLGFVVLNSIGNTKESAIYDENDCWVYIISRRSQAS